MVTCYRMSWREISWCHIRFQITPWNVTQQCAGSCAKCFVAVFWTCVSGLACVKFSGVYRYKWWTCWSTRDVKELTVMVRQLSNEMSSPWYTEENSVRWILNNILKPGKSRLCFSFTLFFIKPLILCTSFNYMFTHVDFHGFSILLRRNMNYQSF